MSNGSNTNCLVLRRESKGAAKYEFCRQAKASTASPACRKNPSGFLPEGDSHPHLFFLPKNTYFVVALSVGYLRAIARVPPVYLLRSRLELNLFVLKNLRRYAQYTSQVLSAN